MRENTTKKVSDNNEIAVQQQKLEEVEILRSRLLLDNQDQASSKMQVTREQSQILFAINNL